MHYGEVGEWRAVEEVQVAAKPLAGRGRTNAYSRPAGNNVVCRACWRLRRVLLLYTLKLTVFFVVAKCFMKASVSVDRAACR